MKQLVAISLILLLTWQTIFNAGFFVYWKVNQNFIAKTLCENKNKPQMHCNGKCYLYKQLKKAEEKEAEKNSLPNSIPKFKSVDSFIVLNHDWRTIFPSYLTYKQKHVSYKSNLLIGYQNSLFRPPEFIWFYKIIQISFQFHWRLDILLFKLNKKWKN